MKVLELMCSLEEAYDRFGDIDVIIHEYHEGLPVSDSPVQYRPSNLIIESDQFVICCEYIGE